VGWHCTVHSALYASAVVISSAWNSTKEYGLLLVGVWPVCRATVCTDRNSWIPSKVFWSICTLRGLVSCVTVPGLPHNVPYCLSCSHQWMIKTLEVPLHLPSSNLMDVMYYRRLFALISAEVEDSHAVMIFSQHSCTFLLLWLIMMDFKKESLTVFSRTA